MNHLTLKLAALFRHFDPVLTGAGERFRRYALGLKTRGISMEVHTSDVDEAPVHSDGTPSIYRHPASKAAHHETDLAILHAALAKLENDDLSSLVLQVTSTNPKCNRILARWKRQHQVPTVFVGTMVEPISPPSGIIEKIKQPLRFKVMRDAFSHFIASSTEMKSAFEERGVRPDRITVIPSGVDTSRFCPIEDKDARRAELDLPKESHIVLYVGNLIPRKGIDRLLNAWQKHCEDQPAANDLLLVVGPRHRPTFVGRKMQEDLRGFQERLDQIIAKIPEKRIRFIDELEAIERAYQAADLFVFPSLKEGMPNAVMEAMASGLPVATSKFIGFPEHEFGKESEEYLHIGNSPVEIAEQLSSLLKNPALRAKLSANARAWAVNHLDLEHTLDQYADTYRSLLERAC